MCEIRIIIDLPDNHMRKALKLQPLLADYDSAKLKDAVKRRPPEEFPQAKIIKVNTAPTNGFPGADVMGTDADEALDAMKKVSNIISSVIREEAGNKNIK